MPTVASPACSIDTHVLRPTNLRLVLQTALARAAGKPMSLVSILAASGRGSASGYSRLRFVRCQIVHVNNEADWRGVVSRAGGRLMVVDYFATYAQLARLRLARSVGDYWATPLTCVHGCPGDAAVGAGRASKLPLSWTS